MAERGKAWQAVAKSVFEIVLIPLAVPLVRRMKQFEDGTDGNDDLSYGIFDVFKRDRP